MKETPASNPSVYQVKDWDLHFEGAKSKTYNNKSSCTMPTKHGLGYKRIVRSKDGAAIFGAWCALIQVLSRHQKPRQGYCTDTGSIDGNPYTPDDLEILTDIPAKHFESLFQMASNQSVTWLRIPQGYHKDIKYPLNSNSDLNSNSNSNLNLNGNPPVPECPGQNGTPTTDKSNSRFIKPTSNEVTEYAKTINFTLDGETFVNFYESKGWVVGKSPMKSWQAAVKTWKGKGQTSEPEYILKADRKENQ